MLRVKANLDTSQAVESLFVTVTLNGTMVPAWTPVLCDGVTKMVGLARVQASRDAGRAVATFVGDAAAGKAFAAWTAAAAFTRP